jgi:hypothetical protein
MSAGEPLKIAGTDRRGDDRVLVEYSDKTTATYTAQQLATLKRSPEVESESLLDDKSSERTHESS